MSSSQLVVDVQNLRRTYQVGSEEVVALHDVSIQIPSGQFIAVVGRSGSGKTTLLNLMAGLDKPSSGQVLFEGKDLSKMSEKELTNIRRHKIGFVFQAFGLLPLLSAFENVELPLRIAGYSLKEREERTKEALGIVGLLRRGHHRPYELSGGEQQRVAIARAIVTRPPLILADEPTGELDSTNAKSIFGLFREMVEEHGVSVVAATHDSTLLAMADQVNEMRDGRVVAHLEGKELEHRLHDAHSSRFRQSAAPMHSPGEISEKLGADEPAKATVSDERFRGPVESAESRTATPAAEEVRLEADKGAPPPESGQKSREEYMKRFRRPDSK